MSCKEPRSSGILKIVTLRSPGVKKGSGVGLLKLNGMIYYEFVASYPGVWINSFTATLIFRIKHFKLLMLSVKASDLNIEVCLCVFVGWYLVNTIIFWIILTKNQNNKKLIFFTIFFSHKFSFLHSCWYFDNSSPALYELTG